MAFFRAEWGGVEAIFNILNIYDFDLFSIYETYRIILFIGSSRTGKTDCLWRDGGEELIGKEHE